MIDVHTLYYYLPLSSKRWSWFEYAVGGVLICSGVVADVKYGVDGQLK
jgi:hypothetical protein